MNEDEAKSRLSKHMQPIRRFFTGALSRYENEYEASARADHDASIQAQCIHGHVMRAASEYAARFPDHEVRFSNAQNLEHLLIDGHVAIRFKKLKRKKLQPSNNETPQSLAFRTNKPIDGITASVRLDAGYVLSRARDAIESIHLIRWSSPKRWFWAMELADDGYKSVVRPLFETMPEDDHDAPPATIKPKEAEVVPFRVELDDED